VHVKIQSYRCAISIADSTWCTFMDKLCGLYIYIYICYVSISLSSMSSYLCWCAFCTAFILSNISMASHARHAAADPRDICPDQSGTRYSRSEGLVDWAGGVINHRPLCSVEFHENIVPGGTATWRTFLFSLPRGVRHLQLTFFSSLYY